tara:strand:- start:51 stop:158 length:108 start_codon:yes stop_codon:yes gene_type:complete
MLVVVQVPDLTHKQVVAVAAPMGKQVQVVEDPLVE